MQFGVYSFGDLTADPVTGARLTAAERLGEVLAQAKLADSAGLSVFALGEHHRLDFTVSATTVALAAIAAQTKAIRLASAVTILATADPVRVFEEYATLDLLSGGRAEIIAGRGIYTESFPLFGLSVDDQDALYSENLELLMQLNASPRVTWQGKFRAPLADAEIAPRPERPIPIWVGTGGTPASTERAGKLGLPLSLGNITLPPEKLAPAVAAYRAAGKAAGHTEPARRCREAPLSRARQPDGARRILPALCELHRLAFDEPVPEDRGDARDLRGTRGTRRRALRRQPAGDRRQDRPRARALRPRPADGPDRHRRPPLQERRKRDRALCERR